MWMAYVLIALPVAGMGLAFLLSWAFPGLPESVGIAIWGGTPIAFVVAYAVVRGRRARRAAGLVPDRSGYTASVELLAVKLRERAEAIERSLRFGHAPEDARELQSFADEVKVPAERFDRRELMAGLDVSHPLETYLGGGPKPEGADAALAAHARALRIAATEAEAYAAELRAKGGLFRSSPGEALGCSVVLLASFGWGAWLLRSGFKAGELSILGAGLVLGSLVLLLALVANLRGER
jgi:hypothetical protein